MTSPDITSVPGASVLLRTLQQHPRVREVVPSIKVETQMRRTHPALEFRSFQNMVRVALYSESTRVDFDVTPQVGVKPLVLEAQLKQDIFVGHPAEPVVPAGPPPAPSSSPSGPVGMEAYLATIVQFVDLMTGLDFAVEIVDDRVAVRYRQMADVDAALAGLRQLGWEVRFEVTADAPQLRVIKQFPPGPANHARAVLLSDSKNG